MYQPNFLISVKTRAELPVVKDILTNDWGHANKDFTQGSYFSATYLLVYAIYNLLYRNMVPLKVEEILNDALKKIGGMVF